MPSDYAPLYFASQVLPDGRVLVEGGEYNGAGCPGPLEVSLGAIYDPLANKWRKVNPPDGWDEIGDSPSIVLPNGIFMLGQNESTASAFFNPKTLGWTLKGSGKADAYAEEGMELLPDGKVLLADTQDTPNTEIFNPKTFAWTSAGSAMVNLSENAGEETGPALLRPDGTVFAMGANGNGAGHTAIFDTKTGEWAAGPDFPNNNDMADAPAAVLPDGNILCETSPLVFKTPVSFYEFDGTKFNSVPNPKYTGNKKQKSNTSYVGRLLVLPTGQIFYTLADGFTKDAEIYTAKGTVQIVMGASDHNRSEYGNPRGHLQNLGNAVQRPDPWCGLRRRCADEQQLSAGAHHQQGERPRVLRAHARPQHHGRRHGQEDCVDEFRRAVRYGDRRQQSGGRCQWHPFGLRSM